MKGSAVSLPPLNAPYHLLLILCILQIDQQACQCLSAREGFICFLCILRMGQQTWVAQALQCVTMGQQTWVAQALQCVTIL